MSNIKTTLKEEKTRHMTQSEESGQTYKERTIC